MDSLSKYLAQSGACSRRMATELIKLGKVTVNGIVVKEPGYKLPPGAAVKVGRKSIGRQEKVYIALNKPKGFITTVADDKARDTVMNLLLGAPKVRLYPIGRLDRDTTGLLLFTNDGDLAQKLAHPKFEVIKEYIVTLDRDLSVPDYQLLCKDILLKDGLVRVDSIEMMYIRARNVLKVRIHSGKNRIIRRIFSHFGYFVNALDRVSFAGLSKRAIPIGRWRFLTGAEVRRLKGEEIPKKDTVQQKKGRVQKK